MTVPLGCGTLPVALKAFVDQQVDAGGSRTSSESVCKLIRKDQDVQRLRGLLFDGAASAATSPVDAGYFQSLRERATQSNAS